MSLSPFHSARLLTLVYVSSRMAEYYFGDLTFCPNIPTDENYGSYYYIYFELQAHSRTQFTILHEEHKIPFSFLATYAKFLGALPFHFYIFIVYLQYLQFII